MKPQLQNSHDPKLFRGGSTRIGSPLSDYSYLGKIGEFRGRGAGLKATARSSNPSIREVSNDFIKSEMKWHYAAEAGFFAIIVALSTWPIIPTVRAMADLIR
jgi:hypothetical protein